MFDDWFWPIFFLVLFIAVLIFGGYMISKDIMTRQDILEKTEQYEKYDYCENVGGKFYCFNESVVSE